MTLKNVVNGFLNANPPKESVEKWLHDLSPKALRTLILVHQGIVYDKDEEDLIFYFEFLGSVVMNLSGVRYPNGKMINIIHGLGFLSYFEAARRLGLGEYEYDGALDKRVEDLDYVGSLLKLKEGMDLRDVMDEIMEEIENNGDFERKFNPNNMSDEDMERELSSLIDDFEEEMHLN